MALSSWCIAGSRRIRHLCSGRWSSGCFGFTWGLVEFRKMLWRLPPIHFGREDGVERTLLRVACQSETFLASPWQGDASIRFLWHIGCQSEIDEPVSLASRPVDRGSCRRKCFSTSLYPVKGSFGRMGSGCRFSPAATHTPRSGPSTVSCVPLRGTCLRRTPTHYIRSAHQCAGRAVYFAAAKYGKAGRPPGVATLVAVRGLVPSGCIACSLKHRRHYFATRKTPLNTCRILQRSTKGVT